MTTIEQATPLQRRLYLEHKARLARIYPPRQPPPEPLSLARVVIVDHPEEDGPIEVLIRESSLMTLLRDVALRHNFEPATLQSDLRLDPVVRARNEFCYLAALRTPSSLAAIGRFIGKDHTTVLYAIGAHATRLALPLPRNMSQNAFLSRVTRKVSSAECPRCG
jgi:hypothetical protein